MNASYVSIPGELKQFRAQIIIGKEQIDLDASKIFEIAVRYAIGRGYVSGYLKLQDTLSIFEFVGPYNYIFFRLTATDCLGLEYDAVYSLTRIEKQNSNNGSIIYCEFIDEFAYVLNSTFISAGYKNVSVPEVLAGVYKKLLDSKSFVHNKTLNVSNFEKYKELVIPGNKSIFGWIMHRSNIDNFTVIDDRGGIDIIKSDEIWSKAKSTKLKLEKHLKSSTPFTIREVSIIQDSTDLTLHYPNELYVCTESNKIKTTQNNINTLGSGLVLPECNSQIGIKVTDKNNKSKHNLKSIDITKLAVTLNAGAFCYNLLQKVSIEIPSLALKGFNKPMLNGEYIITAIEDRVTAGILNQTLTLSRPGVS